jgi:hypothetical protein
MMALSKRDHVFGVTALVVMLASMRILLLEAHAGWL